MRGPHFLYRLSLHLLWLVLPFCTAHAQPGPSPASCVQQGGALQCKPAIAGPWRYHPLDTKSLQYPDEASAYAHLLQTRDPASVFTLVYRWSDANPLGFSRSRSHGIETASWKIYRRCMPDAAGLDCDAHPEYLGYQRMRDVSCPPGYAFGDDPNAPYCLPQAYRAATAANDASVASVAPR